MNLSNFSLSHSTSQCDVFQRNMTAIQEAQGGEDDTARVYGMEKAEEEEGMAPASVLPSGPPISDFFPSPILMSPLFFSSQLCE